MVQHALLHCTSYECIYWYTRYILLFVIPCKRLTPAHYRKTQNVQRQKFPEIIAGDRYTLIETKIGGNHWQGNWIREKGGRRNRLCWCLFARRCGGNTCFIKVSFSRRVCPDIADVSWCWGAVLTVHGAFYFIFENPEWYICQGESEKIKLSFCCYCKSFLSLWFRILAMPCPAMPLNKCFTGTVCLPLGRRSSVSTPSTFVRLAIHGGGGARDLAVRIFTCTGL